MSMEEKIKFWKGINDNYFTSTNDFKVHQLINNQSQFTNSKQKINPPNHKSKSSMISDEIENLKKDIELKEYDNMNKFEQIKLKCSKDEYTDDINDKQYGMFGTANGLGRVIGCFLFTILVNNFNRKWTFVFFTVVKSLFLVLFKFTNIGWLLITCRGLIGLTHMPPSIYIPVWIDQFGLKNYKTMFLTILQVVIPLGKVEGFYLSKFWGGKDVSYFCYL